MLRSYYKYWEEFVSEWTKTGAPLPCWTAPKDIPLYNSNKKKDPTEDYLPEPWWGWHPDNGVKLESVVINFNPGEGGCKQCIFNCSRITSYQRLVDFNTTGSVPPSLPNLNETNTWHTSRAKSIHKGLGMTPCIKNHLSIELIPWHTKAVNASYWNYFDQNIVEIYEHVLKFAACASHEINNCVLKRKVLIRCGKGAISKLIGELNFNGIATHPLTKIVSLGKSTCFFKFNIEGIKNVEFVALWGPTGNDMPADLDIVFCHKEF